MPNYPYSSLCRTFFIFILMLSPYVSLASPADKLAVSTSLETNNNVEFSATSKVFLNTISAKEIPAWDSNDVLYKIGDFVTYKGYIYKIVTEHRSNSAWLPDTVRYYEKQGLVGDKLDSDNDGIEDNVDNCPDRSNPDQKDTDGDKIGDACDADSGNIPAWDSNDVLYKVGDLVTYKGYIYKIVTEHRSNSAWLPDTVRYYEKQGLVGDKLDSDADGIEDNVDNCPDISNPDQKDTDGDNIGDVCDSDSGTETKTDAEIVALDNKALTFTIIKKQNGSETTILSHLNLIVTGVNGSAIAWTSSKSTFIQTTGEVTRPTTEQGDQAVTLTATIVKGDAKETKSFQLTVKALHQNGEENKRFVVGYLPTWSIQSFHEADYATSQIATIDPLYSHVIISFGKPDMTFNGTDFIGTGIEFSSHLGAIKKAIEALQKRGVKVLLAVGGATYNNWDALVNEKGITLAASTHKKALKAVVDALNLDGLDVDYEVSGADSANVERYYQSILQLKEVAGDKLLTLAGWSTGADCTAGTSSDTDCAGKLSYWGGSAGRERLTFNKLKDNGYPTESLFNYVAIMTYDGGLSRFDPVTLFKNYQQIYKGALAMGFEIPTESWGGAELVATDADAQSCASTSMLSGDSYAESSSKKSYSIERLVNYVNSVPNAGVMLWSLYENKVTRCNKAVDYTSFTVAINTYLSKATPVNEINKGSIVMTIVNFLLEE